MNQRKRGGKARYNPVKGMFPSAAGFGSRLVSSRLARRRFGDHPARTSSFKGVSRCREGLLLRWVGKAREVEDAVVEPLLSKNLSDMSRQASTIYAVIYGERITWQNLSQ